MHDQHRHVAFLAGCGDLTASPPLIPLRLPSRCVAQQRVLARASRQVPCLRLSTLLVAPPGFYRRRPRNSVIMQCMPRGLFGRRRKVGTAQPPAPDSPAARPPSPVRPAHDSSVSSPTEANSGPGPPSHRPLSHVKDGAGDTPSQQEPPPGPEPTSHAGVEPARNPTPAPSSDASSVKPAPIQDPLLSPAPAWGPEDHAESLWAAAYDSLREQEPDLVRQYELDVYACISTPDRRDFALGRLAGIILSRPGDAEIPLPETGHLMSSFVEAYLCEPDQDCRSDTVKKDDLDSPGLETEGVDGKGLRCLWDGMRAVMRRSQYASIPWVASCIALEVSRNIPSHTVPSSVYKMSTVLNMCFIT